MPSDSRSSLLIILLGIMSLVFPTLTSTHDGPSAAAPAPLASSVASAKPAAPEFCEGELLRPLAQHFGTDDFGARLAKTSLSFLVATVPDPIDSGLAYEFDRDLEALQLAIERDARLRDRSWLPWNPLAATSPSDVDATRTCRRTVPGLVLFREATTPPDPERLLVLLLVGETPTWGVHKLALQRAFDLVATLSNATEARIVGPSFSGSADSIRRAIDEYAALRRDEPHVQTFRFVSGTASSRTNRTVLDTGDAGAPRLSFRATTAPDDTLACRFYDYLGRLGVDRDGARLRHVALLHESGTEYGSGFDVAKRATTTNAPDTSCARPEAEIGFPPHISYLRSAYESEERKNAPARDDGAPAIPVTRLEPSLDEGAPPLDVEPTLSNKTTFAHDVVLSNLLLDIARRDVHYLGIVATDPADVIFLARQIRRVVPDIRLFTFGSEVLFLHKSYATDLDGMLVVSSYPFFGATEFRRPARGSGTILTFSGQGPEGIYNAALASLHGAATGLVEYPPFGAPVGGVLPGWVSVVSRGRLVPLEAMALGTTDYLLGEPATAPSSDALASMAPPGAKTAPAAWSTSPSKPWLVCLFLSSLVVWANLAALGRRFLGRRSSLAGVSGAVSRVARFFERFEPCVAPEERFRQSYYVYATVLALTLTHWTLLCGPSVFVAAWSDPSPVLVPLVVGIVTGVVAVVGTIAALVMVVVGRGEYARSKGNERAVTRSVTLSALVVTLVGLVATVGLFLALRVADAQAAIFAERATDLFGGASPIPPLVIVGACMYVWGLSQLSRIRLVDALHARWMPGTGGIVPSFRPGTADGFRADFRRLVDDILGALGSMSGAGAAYWAGLVALVGTALLIFVLQPPRLFEGQPAKGLMVGAFALVVLVTGSGIVRLLMFSVRFGTLLRRIGRHPIAEAFGRLPEQFARTVESMVSAPSADIEDLVVPVRQADTLATTADAIKGGGRVDISGAIGASVDRFVASVHGEAAANGRPATSPLRAELRAELSDAAKGDGRIDLGDSPTMGRLTRAATILWDVVDPFWQVRVPRAPTQTAAPIEHTMTNALDVYADTLTEPARAWMRLAEELVATHLTFTIAQLLRHFRHFTTMVTVGAFTLLLFISSYAIQPKRLLLTFVWVVMLSAVGAGMYVFFALERDEVLSRIGKTDPGKVTLSAAVITRVFTWGVLPILGVVAAQYPELGRAAFGWLAPVARMMH